MNDNLDAVPGAETTVEELLAAEPLVARQPFIHWSLFALGVISLALVMVLMQWGVLPTIAEHQGHAPPVVVVALLLAHGVACLAGLGWHFLRARELRQDSGSDKRRLQQILRHLRLRRWLLLGLALLGQVVVIVAGFYALDFSGAPYLLVALVPTFLLLSMSLRHPPSASRLAGQVRRLRSLQQLREL